MLKLIRCYLESGIMQQGLVEPRTEGTPQGGQLSPLLSNILLDDLDKELERRGHRFCRYADDCNIYVSSRRAGERVMTSLSRFLREKLKLTVNPKKSAVDRPWKRKFLGFSMTAQRGCRVRVAPQAVERFNGRGPWWNVGASHMNTALPTAYFRKMGYIPLLELVNWFRTLRELRSS